jgi:ribosomal protein S27AE
MSRDTAWGVRYHPCVARTGGVVGWWHRRRGLRIRRCSQCGYEWPMPKAGHHLGGDSQNGLQSKDIYGNRGRRIAIWDDPEVHEALSHCPQCGSGTFTEYRTERPTET